MARRFHSAATFLKQPHGRNRRLPMHAGSVMPSPGRLPVEAPVAITAPLENFRLFGCRAPRRPYETAV